MGCIKFGRGSIMTNENETPVKTLSFGCACLWLWVLLQFCFGIIAAMLLLISGQDAMLVFAEVPAIICVVTACLKYGIPKVNKPVHFAATFGQGLAVGLFFSTVWSLVLSIFQTDLGNVSFTLDAGTFLIVGIVGPILEELFFRGFLYKQLARYNWVYAMVTSAILFGLIHANFGQGVFAALFGLILAWSYHKTNSILTPIALHMANNCLSLLTTQFWWTSLVMLGLTIAGLIILVCKIPAITRTLEKEGPQARKYGSYTFDSAWIWTFLVMAGILSFVLSM